MDRRGFLHLAGVGGTLTLAGCLDRLGFEEQSAWRDPPLVTNRPNAVYHPASAEDMGIYGTTSDGAYAVALSYTYPHRFWTVTGSETNRVVVDADDTMHLMVSVWDVETDTILPVEMRLEVRQNGSVVEQFVPWPMLSQRMGFHYGDNAVLPGEGSYTARIHVGPMQARRRGAFADRFTDARTLDIDFEYSRSDIHALEFEVYDTDTQGTPAALPLMDHGQGGDHDGESPHVPVSRSHPVDSLPGTHIGTERSGDADFVVVETDGDGLTDTDSYLAVSPRTPYNGILLPFCSLSATVDRDGTTVLAEPLQEALAPDFGHHYGLGIDSLQAGDRLTITVDSPPAVSRHDGYETAFFEFEDITFVR